MDSQFPDSKVPTSGAASCVVVLLPGLDGTGVLFRPLIAHLPNDIKPLVVAFPPDEPLGYEQLLARVLAALPKDRPFVILGESFSGPLALMAAATRPANLIGIILCATFVQNPVIFRPGWLRHFARPLPFRFFPVLSRLKALLAGYSTPELQALSIEALSPVRPEVLAHRVRAVLQVNVVQELRSCPVPILYLRGLRDYVVPEHNLTQIARVNRSVQVERLPSSHWVLQTQPAAAATAIANFVRHLHGQISRPQRA